MDSLFAYSPAVMLYEKGSRPPASGGLADMISFASTGGHLFGDLGTDRHKQLSQYFGAVASCVRYRSQIIGQVPTLVRVGTKDEKTKADWQRRAWAMKAKSFEMGRGRDPGPPPFGRRWVSALVRKSMAGGVRQNEELEYLDDADGPVRLFNDPNGPQTGEQLWPLINTYLDLCGVAYLWVVPDSSGQPAALWVIPSSWVEEVPRDAGTPKGEFFRCYRVRSSGTTELPPYDATVKQPNGGVIRFCVESPLSPLLPDSRVFAHRFDVDMLGMIQSARYAGLQNAGEIGTSIEMDPDVSVAPDVLARFVDQFQAKYAGVFNQNKVTFVPPGFTINRPPPGREASYAQSEQAAWERVFEVFDIDYNAVFKAGNSNYAAPAVARQNFRFNTVMPRQKYIASVLTEKLCPAFGKGVRAVFEDGGGYADPQEKRANFMAAMNAPTGSAVTLNEIRKELCGLEPVDDPNADELWVKPGFVLLTDMDEAGQDVMAGGSGGAFGDSGKVPRGTFGDEKPENEGETGGLDDEDAGSLFGKEVRHSVTDGRFMPSAMGAMVSMGGAVSKFAKGVQRKADELVEWVRGVGLEQGVTGDRVTGMVDSLMQVMATKHHDAIRDHLGVDHQTAVEVASHVIAHVSHRLRTRLAKEFEQYNRLVQLGLFDVPSENGVCHE